MILAPLILAGLVLLVIALARRASFSLRLALAGYVVFWLLIPLGYRLWAGLDPIGDDTDRWYGTVVLAHAVAVALTVLLALTVPSPFVRIAANARLARWRLDGRLYCFALAMGAAAIAGARLWQFRAAGGDFASLVALNISRDREAIGGFTLVSALAGGYLSLALATLAAGGGVSFRTRVLAWVCVTAVAMQNVVVGLRAFLLLPFWGLFLLAGNAEPGRRRRSWVTAAAAGVVALVLVPAAALILGVTRTSSDQTDTGAAGDALEAFTQLEPSERLSLFAAAANLKFDGITTGATLLALDGPGGGGLRPLTSALLSPIPRILLPSKPVPISANGEQSGVPFVRAAQRFGAIEAGMVVPVSPAAVTIWELGWIGLFLFVTVNVLVLWLAEAWLRTAAILPGAFAFSLLSYPTFEFALQSPSGLVRDLLRLAIIWAGLACLGMMAGQKVRTAVPVQDG
jgi:hypothetical protein